MSRVLIVDDHPLFRMGLSMALAAEGFTVVSEAGDGNQAVRAAARDDIELVLLDIRMPGMDGIEACKAITDRDDPPIVVMLTTHDEPGVIAAARQAGATAFLSKETAPKELAKLLRRIVEDPERDWLPHVSLPSLTPREEQTLALLSMGHSNKAIAKEMGLSPDTVKDHLERVFAKLEVRDRLAAVKRAMELGLISHR
ncbi:MAG TPA: response regulator transcription factor, partial [Trueperaceae bacterium]|nr:response regulator transcription factor [Trueperaceae bacterium]